jgi:hypothetical protein
MHTFLPFGCINQYAMNTKGKKIKKFSELNTIFCKYTDELVLTLMALP